MVSQSNLYAIYLRKSRKDKEIEARGEGETLKRHEKILTDLAKRQGLQIGEIYREMVSGDSIDARPEMQRLLEDVHNNRWRGVMVVELERLARGDTKDQGIVAEAFKFSETLIVTPSKTYDPTNEFDEEYFEFGLFMSRREYKTIKRRLSAGVRLSILEGNYLWPKPPYGYDIVDRGRRDRTLKPNDNAPIVRMIFEWYTKEKIAFSAIARRLTDMEIPSPAGYDFWNPASVTKIIKSDAYIGKVHYGTVKRKKEYDPEAGVVRNVKRKSNQDEIIVADGKHPPLIDMETWEIALARHSKNTRIADGKDLSNPLAGLLRCQACGKAMRYKRTHKENEKEYKWFRHRDETAEKCKCQSSAYEDVMKSVAYALKKEIADFQMMLDNADVADAAKKHSSMIEEMEKNLERLKEKRKKLFRYFEDEIYSEEEFLERKEEINTEIENLSNRIKEAYDTKPVEVDYQAKLAKFSEVLEAITSEDVSAKEKNDLLKEIISVIYYSKPSKIEPFQLDITFI